MELTKEKVDLITQKKIDARKKVTDGYVLKGHVLKQVAADITPHLAGVLDGLAEEVLWDDCVNIFTLNRDKGIKAIPFATWRTGTINMSSSKRGLNLEYVVPEGRSKGYLMSKTNRVFIHLLAWFLGKIKVIPALDIWVHVVQGHKIFRHTHLSDDLGL